jgi:uncharacterized protein YbaR (Trm112 family)
MPVDKEWLDILVCPETKQKLDLADERLVERLNAQIDAGKLVSRAGVQITRRIDGGLIRKDEKVLYVVQDEIPNMLMDEAIDLENLPR